MLDCVFLVPIDHRGVQGKLMNNYLNLQSWCNANNSQILTVNGLFLNFARNYLATGGKGFIDPTPPNAEWLFWIDSDVDFSIEQVEQLLSIPSKNKFVSGWYRSDYSDHAMVGNWDEDYFRKQHHMPFLSVEWLDKIGKEELNIRTNLELDLKKLKGELARGIVDAIQGGGGGIHGAVQSLTDSVYGIVKNKRAKARKEAEEEFRGFNIFLGLDETELAAQAKAAGD